MKMVDGFLSSKIQEAWPDAIVFKRAALSPEFTQAWYFWVERPDQEDLGLGYSFKEAQRSAEAIVRGRRQR